jgi:murein DD-endopeptidase MepM/ murein hydrolase activator NlpD
MFRCAATTPFKLSSHKEPRPDAFTLIEVVISIGLLASAMAALAFTVSAVLQARSLAAAQWRLEQAQRVVEWTVRQRLEESNEVLVPQSGSGEILSIASPNPTEDPVQFSVSDNVLLIQTGSSAAVPLTPSNVRMTTFTAERLDGSPPSIRITLRLETTTLNAVAARESVISVTLHYESPSAQAEGGSQAPELPANTFVLENITGTPISFADTQWPIGVPVFLSAFGPRLNNAGAYDFHEGVDLSGARGDPVYAIADGEVFRTYAEDDPTSTFAGLGNVVIIRHNADNPIPFWGTHTEYYSIYGHLDSSEFDFGMTHPPYPHINKGEPVGGMGDSGDVGSVQLHYEIRVETTCAKQTQIDHPEYTCASAFGDTPQEPHVNPFWFHASDDEDQDTFAIETDTVGDDLIVVVRADREELDLNSVSAEAGGEEKTVNFNLREGLSPDDADDQEYEGVTIEPSVFDETSPEYKIQFTFEGLADFDSITAQDVFGGGVRLTNTDEDEETEDNDDYDDEEE